MQRVGGALASQRVVSVHAGWGHTLALCSDGSVFAWGYSAHGRLGFHPPTALAAIGALPTLPSCSCDRVLAGCIQGSVSLMLRPVLL